MIWILKWKFKFLPPYIIFMEINYRVFMYNSHAVWISCINSCAIVIWRACAYKACGQMNLLVRYLSMASTTKSKKNEDKSLINIAEIVRPVPVNISPLWMRRKCIVLPVGVSLSVRNKKISYFSQQPLIAGAWHFITVFV